MYFQFLDFRSGYLFDTYGIVSLELLLFEKMILKRINKGLDSTLLQVVKISNKQNLGK